MRYLHGFIERDKLKKDMRRLSQGWTLAELLIAIAIIAILFLFVWLGLRTQIERGYDANRKTDLDQIVKAFEEYYNDHDCFPPEGILDTCEGSGLNPYLSKIPCDPVTKVPYTYVPESDPCDGHRICASLKDKGDPVIKEIGCDPEAGCGWGAGINYCVSSGVRVTAPGFVAPTPTLTPTPGPAPTSTPTPTPPAGPTPTPTPGGGNYACTPGGQCNIYADPEGAGCPVTFFEQTCNNQCIDPANRCAS